MRIPPLTTRRLMVVVAVAAWVAFNGRLLWGMLALTLQFLPGADALAVALFAVLSCTLCPTGAGLILAWVARKGADRSGLWRFVFGTLAAVAAGFVGWGSATLLFQVICGTSALSSSLLVILPAMGAVVQLAIGVIVSLLWGARARP